MMQHTFKLLGMASLALAIAVPAFAQSADDRQQMMDLVLQMQQLQDEIRLLGDRSKSRPLSWRRSSVVSETSISIWTAA